MMFPAQSHAVLGPELIVAISESSVASGSFFVSEVDEPHSLAATMVAIAGPSKAAIFSTPLLGEFLCSDYHKYKEGESNPLGRQTTGNLLQPSSDELLDPCTCCVQLGRRIFPSLMLCFDSLVT